MKHKCLSNKISSEITQFQHHVYVSLVIRLGTGIFHPFVNIDTEIRWFLSSFLLFLQLFRCKKQPRPSLIAKAQHTEKAMKITSEQAGLYMFENAIKCIGCLVRGLCPLGNQNTLHSVIELY